MWREKSVVFCAVLGVACARSRAPSDCFVPGTPGNWHVVIGAKPQRVPAEALGVPADASVRLGQLWLQVGEKLYPLTKEAGETEIELTSPSPSVDPARLEPHPGLFLPAGFHDEPVRLARSSEHSPGTEYRSGIPVIVRADRALARSARGALQASRVDGPLDVFLVATDSCKRDSLEEFRIRGNPCFLEPKSCERVVARVGDRTIRMGPFVLDFEVGPQLCVVALSH